VTAEIFLVFQFSGRLARSRIGSEILELPITFRSVAAQVVYGPED
jgi:hypothetical protein